VLIEQADQIQGPWVAAYAGWMLVDDTRFGPGLARLTYRSIAPATAASKSFLRLSVRAP
jgi:hypothetical protein